MDVSKIIRGIVNSRGYTITSAITQWDYGYVFVPEFEDMPATYRLDFSNDEHHGTALPVYCGSEGGEVPEELIDTGKDIFVWFFYIGDGFGKSEYKWRIPNHCKPKTEQDEPSPTQQSSIDQLIVRSNEAVEQAEQSASDASQSARSAQGYASQAETAKSDAQTYANNASASATSASQSATASTNSATASAQSASQSAQIKSDVEDLVDDARGYASASAQSASASANSASQASGYAQSASQSARSASDDANRAERAKTSAETAQGKAEDAQESAERAKESAEQSANEARQKAESITGLTATATTLPEGSQATASYSNGVLSLGIPKGDKGESPVTLLLSKDVVYVPMDREYRTKIAITDKIYYEYRRGDEQIDGIMDYTGTLTNTNITCTNVQACTSTQRGYMRFTIPQGVPLRTNTDTQLVVNNRFVFDYTDLDGNRKTIARSIMFVGVMDGEQGEPGDDGYSPTVTITPITGGHRIAITDVDGTKTADVMDGDDYILTEEDKEEIADIVEVPSDWLKAFPTDTASGAVASFSDGADDIPLKSLVVDINPVQDTSSGDPSPENICPISGWTEVDVEQSGVNVWGEEWELGYLNINNGTEVASNNSIRMKNYIGVIPNTNFYFSCVGKNDVFRVIWFDNNKGFISGSSSSVLTNKIVTVPDGAYYMRCFFSASYGTTYNHDISINYPSTDHSYHPYTGRSITIQLGQTVYGGHLDVISGVLTIDRAMVDLGTLTYAVNNHAILGQYFYAEITALRVKYEGAFTSILYNALCSAYKVVPRLPTYLVNGTFCFDGNQTNKQVTQIQIKNTAYTDAATFKAAMTGQQLVYELATPLTIQLTPQQVNSLLGVNNIWADSGDAEIEYRADTKLFIERLTAPDSADMIADSNITSGQYFMVGNNLFRATANIANGASIIVGTNCIRKSLSEALNEINA